LSIELNEPEKILREKNPATDVPKEFSVGHISGLSGGASGCPVMGVEQTSSTNTATSGFAE
jgi:hypothetical protein